MFGIDVQGLDVAAFLTVARCVFIIGALAWLALTLRVRRPG
jgi:hypothetical protein